MKGKFFFGCLIGLCATLPAMGYDNIPDGFKLWMTEWDSASPSLGYSIIEWTYDKSNDYWDATDDLLETPYIQNDASYSGNVYDMSMDLITFDGTLNAIIAASKGDSHFPSQGTEFQHRKLNSEGFWEAVQSPFYTTPAAVSPLGLDMYKEGNAIHMVWIEDNDSDGPKSNKGEIYDCKYTLGADGALTPSGDPVLIYSMTLNWSATHPGNGGLNGITACDWDGDGNTDFVISQMFYGDSPTSAGLYLLEQTSSGVWSKTLKEIYWAATGNGAEALTCGDIDGDKNLDFLRTNEADGDWDQVFWFEKAGDVLELRGMVIDCAIEGEAWGINISHMFGLYANEPAVVGTKVTNWELQ